MGEARVPTGAVATRLVGSEGLGTNVQPMSLPPGLETSASPACLPVGRPRASRKVRESVCVCAPVGSTGGCGHQAGHVPRWVEAPRKAHCSCAWSQRPPGSSGKGLGWPESQVCLQGWRLLPG